MKKLFCFFLACSFGVAGMMAQVLSNPYPVKEIFDKNVTASNKYGKVKAQKIKGKVTGTGLQNGKDGSLYAGDFMDKIPHGQGMYLAPPGQEITGCPSGAFYVGRFKDGLKNGKGKVYNANGELIYQGKFKDDLPIDPYPSPEDYISWFSELESGNGSVYIGEIVGASPYGFGLIIFPDHSYLISNFVDGERTGISVYMQNDGNWVSENVEGDVVTPISSSEEYSTIEANNKAAFRQTLSEALGYFAEAVNVASQGVANYQSLKQGGNASYADYGGYDSAGTSGGKSKGSSSAGGGNGFKLSEQQAYNTDKSSYASYDSLLAQIFAGNRSASSGEIKQIQSKMKSLRKKWEDKGKSFPKSSNEDR